MTALFIATLLMTQAGEVVLSGSGAELLHWDGSKVAPVPLGEQLFAADELANMNPSKLVLGEASVLTLGPKSQIVIDAHDDKQLRVKLGRGRLRIITAGTGKQIVSLFTEHGSLEVSAVSDVVLMITDGKTQTVVLSGSVKATAKGAKASVEVRAGKGVDFDAEAASYDVTESSLIALKHSLTLDETPVAAIAQTLETDLPGFVGPKSTGRRFRGTDESFAEGWRDVPPFPQTPYNAR